MEALIFLLSMLSTLVVLCQGRAQCQSDVDCLHGGTCLTSNFRCACQPSYFGLKCEHKNECHPKCPDQKKCVKKGHENICIDNDSSKMADIVFALEFSHNIDKSEFETMIKTVENFVNKFDFESDKVRFGLFVYNDAVSKKYIELNDSGNKESFLAKLMEFKNDIPRGGVRMDRALNNIRSHMFTEAHGDREIAPNIAFIFTASRSNLPALIKSAANQIKDTNINVLPVGIAENVDLEELKTIATRKDDVFLTTFSELPDLADTLVNKTCKVSTDICYLNPCKNGGKCRKFLTEYICDCPQSYLGTNCEIKCDISADIMVVIDESGKISKEDFDKIIDGVVSFIKSIDIANEKVRLGVISYSTRTIAHFDLDDYDNKLDMLFVCNLLRRGYRGGRSRAHSALSYLRRVSFSHQRGDRLRYPNVALFFEHTTSVYPWITKKYANALHDSGVSVYAIGVGPRIRKSEVTDIASDPKRHHRILTSFTRLELAIKLVITESCEDLASLKPCMNCSYNSDCIPSMICCDGCCQDSVTLIECPECRKEHQCVSSKDCNQLMPICLRGCCSTLLSVKNDPFRECDNWRCDYGWKCCHGVCKHPISVEVGCERSKVCQQYPSYEKCKEGGQCCQQCDDDYDGLDAY